MVQAVQKVIFQCLTVYGLQQYIYIYNIPAKKKFLYNCKNCVDFCINLFWFVVLVAAAFLDCL